MTSNINWNDITFISKSDEWFVSGTTVKLLADFSEDIRAGDTNTINSGFGLFEGYTNETYTGYDGELPRLDEETCAFSEFNMYYDSVKVNDYTIEELENLIKIKERTKKLQEIFSL